MFSTSLVYNYKSDEKRGAAIWVQPQSVVLGVMISLNQQVTVFVLKLITNILLLK